MTPPIISRRSMVGTAISGVAAWLWNRLSVLSVHSRESMASHAELLALCSNLRCSTPMGKACQLDLPRAEANQSSLARRILADVASERRLPPNRLAYAIANRSRNDFQEGKILRIDGWILFLTETRVYALAGLLSDPAVPAS